MAAKRVLVVGGGIAGCMSAKALVEEGYQVTLVERNQIAAQTSGESSWAGAGIALPLLPWAYGEEVNQLALNGARAYPALCAQLLAETGIDPECIMSGMLIKPPYAREQAISWCAAHQMPAQLQGDDLWLPEVLQVRNPRLLQALKQWLIQHRVALREHTQLKPLEENSRTQAHLNAWQTTTGETLEADFFVVTSGAWSFELLKQTTLTLEIKPMRGQIILYHLAQATLRHIVYQNGFYLVPRSDGHVLAGSTLEDVGFDTRTTETAKIAIQQQAEALLPSLKNAPILKHWSGLRPGSPNNIPSIGQHPHLHNLYLNTGHFRYGVTMAPESAKRLVEAMRAA